MTRLLCLLVLCAPLCAQPNADIRAAFTKLAADNPDVVRMVDLPGGELGQYVLSIGNDQRPAVLVLGSLRGDEASPAVACLELARALMADAESRKLLGETELIIIPVPNPRGRQALFARPALAVPGTALLFDDDRDGANDEDGPRDINGDGVISQMRVKRAGGKYVPHKKDPRLLVPAEAGEVGEYDLYWEGVDDDADGRINEDPAGTITLSNDWPIRWSDTQEGANRFSMQLPQTRALAEFILANPRIYAAFQVRSVGARVEFAKGPPVRGGENPYKRDAELAAVLAKSFGDHRSAVGGAPEGAGNVLDWLYECVGVLTANVYLAEIPPPPKDRDEKEKDKDKDGEEDSPEMGDETPGRPGRGSRAASKDADLAWLAYAPDRFREWKAFKHPQLEDVEIGGWEVAARRDAEPEDVVAGVKSLRELVTAALKAAPRASISKVEVEDRGGGIYRVRATLHNPGTLDYRSAFAMQNRIGLPLFVKLEESKAIELVSGTRRQSHENVEGGAIATFEWVIRCGDPAMNLTFTLEAARTGNVTEKIAIKDCKKLLTEEE